MPLPEGLGGRLGGRLGGGLGGTLGMLLPEETGGLSEVKPVFKIM